MLASMAIGDRIKEAREAAGLKQKDLAKLMGVEGASVSQWESGGTTPDMSRLPRLAEVLKRPQSFFVEPELAALRAAPEALKGLPPLLTMPRDVPIYGVAAATSDLEESFNIDGEIIDYGRRPPALLEVRDVYGLFVASDSMEPVYRRGDLIYIRRRLEARIGDDVIIQLRPRHEGDPPSCFIKRLVRRTATKIMTEQYNPRKSLDFPLDRVIELHRVLRLQEFLGV